MGNSTMHALEGEKKEGDLPSDQRTVLLAMTDFVVLSFLEKLQYLPSGTRRRAKEIFTLGMKDWNLDKLS